MVGRGWFYYVTIGSVLSVLALSANTGFADFPRLCRVIAQDGFLPHSFAHRGRRLVYSHGILVLAVLSAGLLIGFGGITDHLIPLFAVGAFLAFTLSQAGMVAHWRRSDGGPSAGVDGDQRPRRARHGVTLVVVLVSKFAEGAWVMILLIPAAARDRSSMVSRHYQAVAVEIANPLPLDVDEPAAADRHHPDEPVEPDVAEGAAVRAEAVARDLRRARQAGARTRTTWRRAGRSSSKRRPGAPTCRCRDW